MILYKYYSCNERVIGFLNDNKISFSDISSLNDPFEGFGRYNYSSTPEEQQYWKEIGSNLKQHIAERTFEDSYELLDFKFRLFSVTEEYDNPLMWAHYAASHTGFCVGYDAEDIRRSCSSLQKVAYTDEPSDIDITDFSEDTMREIESILYVKSQSWEYEQEWRGIYELQSNDVNHLPWNMYGECFLSRSEIAPERQLRKYKPHGYAAMGTNEILESERYILRSCGASVVYLGLRTSANDRNAIIDICKKKNMSVFQMQQQHGKFSLTCLPVVTG